MSLNTLLSLVLLLGCRSVLCAPGCNSTLFPGFNDLGADIAHSPCADAASCAARCCAEPACAAFTFTTSQPHGAPPCAQGSACCWLKPRSGARVAAASCTSGVAARGGGGFRAPVLTRVATIAADARAHLRDPSSVVRDAATGLWHFMVDYIPLAQGVSSGWHALLHHFVAPSAAGPWTDRGLALNWSAAPDAPDSWGTFSPSLLFDDGDKLWYLFYSGTSRASYNATQSCAQLVASAPSPDGPWTRRGVACAPDGAPPAWNQSWHARRCDSGRAMVVGARRGYWTKGVSGYALAQEGAFFPANASSFAPPYEPWAQNPIFPALPETEGMENCEFFAGPAGEPGGPWLHVLCQNHGAGQPHFVTKDALHWKLLGELDTGAALEPTPVYDGMPGDAAPVNFFIARADATPAAPNLHIDLHSLSWV
jgi:hypothetical protein